MSYHENYRKTGLQSIPSIPDHWDLKRLKHLITMSYGDALAAEIRVDGEVGVYGSNGQVGKHIEANTGAPVIVIGRKGSYGKLNFSLTPVFCIDTAYHVAQSVCEANLRFIYYAMQTLGLDTLSQDTGVPGLSREVAYRQYIALPPLSEQLAIASYLDAETARIDGLIEGKKKLIASIEEMEVSLRFELATQGLDTSVETKDSGIEWAPAIPCHWTVKRNMFLFYQRREQGVDGLPILKVSLHTGVSEGEEDDDGTTRVRKQMEDRTAYQIVRTGDVAYNMMRAWQGAIGAVPVDGLVSPAYVVLEPSKELDARYFEMLARTPQYMKDFERYSYGIASFRWRLYWEGFKEIRTPIPPIEEQSLIVKAFENRRQQFRELRAHVERELETLAELRSATITDAVLGRIDVREHMKN